MNRSGEPMIRLITATFEEKDIYKNKYLYKYKQKVKGQDERQKQLMATFECFVM